MARLGCSSWQARLISRARHMPGWLGIVLDHGHCEALCAPESPTLLLVRGRSGVLPSISRSGCWIRTARQPMRRASMPREARGAPVRAFLNGKGGILLIGVASSGEPTGLEYGIRDFSDRKTIDGFESRFRRADGEFAEAALINHPKH